LESAVRDTGVFSPKLVVLAGTLFGGPVPTTVEMVYDWADASAVQKIVRQKARILMRGIR
jgi:hypothetical protein